MTVTDTSRLPSFPAVLVGLFAICMAYQFWNGREIRRSVRGHWEDSDPVFYPMLIGCFGVFFFCLLWSF